MQALRYLDTRLPNGSHVILTGLVDGRFLWDNLHDRYHPLGKCELLWSPSRLSAPCSYLYLAKGFFFASKQVESSCHLSSHQQRDRVAKSCHWNDRLHLHMILATTGTKAFSRLCGIPKAPQSLPLSPQLLCYLLWVISPLRSTCLFSGSLSSPFLFLTHYICLYWALHCYPGKHNKNISSLPGSLWSLFLGT